MELPDLVESAYAAGSAAWPQVRLDRAVFAAHLRGSGLDAERLLARAADLYLAAGCMGGDKAALLAFERTYLLPVPKLLTRIGLNPQQQDELRQLLRIRLLLGPAPRIGEYTGLGPLGAWVRVCALRLALTLKNGNDQRRAEADALDALVADFGGNDLVRMDAEEHGAAWKSAVQEAIAGLSAREKTVLRLHFLEGMTIDSLGAIFRVHRATVARWLVAIRQQLQEAVRAKLSVSTGASRSEAVSLVRMLRNEVAVSVRRILSEEARPSSPGVVEGNTDS